MPIIKTLLRSKVGWLIKLGLFSAVLVGAYLLVIQQLKTQAMVVRAEVGTIVKSVSGSAMVRPEVDTHLLSPGSGFIKESRLKAGLAVKRGESLASIDEGDLPFRIRATELELQKVEQELQKDSPEEIQLKNLREQLQSERELLRDEATTQMAVKELETQVGELVSQIESATKDLETQRDILKNDLDSLNDLMERLVIRAPFDGIITDVLAHPGDLMSRGFRVARIISLEQKIEVQVNQEDIGILREDTQALVRFFAHGGRILKGRVTQILPGSDLNTQRFTAIVQIFDTDAEQLRPGMTGEASFIAGQNQRSVIIPRRALLGDSVFVVDNKGTVDIREVQRGFINLEAAEIIQGLQAGEHVILEDLDLFREGDRVTVKDVSEREKLFGSAAN
ncbi:MAG: efflux RND transporter periplasmic adaptor subunit [Opitutales bacterium]